MKDEVGARERALVAARQASAYLDGEVHELGAEFDVELTLRAADGHALGSGRGKSRALYAAIREATPSRRERVRVGAAVDRKVRAAQLVTGQQARLKAQPCNPTVFAVSP